MQKELKKLIDVDIFGNCGSFTCSRDNKTACHLQLERDYKFYLSFENSICEDYVTEKFFNILKYNVLPITYNGVNMSVVAPPHSHLNSLEFKSVSALAKQLKSVMEDDALYASYFWWKDFYEVRTEALDKAQAFCELCRALHKDAKPQVYSDLHRWWVTESHCKKIKLQ